jgi:hypothetical protein
MKVLYTPDDAPEGASEESAHKSYEVEKILNHTTRAEDGEALFLVKWKGYPTSESSWLARSRFNDLKIVDEYLKSTNGIRRSQRKRKPNLATVRPSIRQIPNPSPASGHCIHPSRLENSQEI